MNANFYALISGQRRGLGAMLARLMLVGLSVPYGLVVRMRNLLFDLGWRRSFPAAVPVISVGNLTVGGTGKTPCVEYLARFFRRHDLRVAILSRGYGSDSGCNDEALVLEENLDDVPHLQNSDRASLARIAVEELESEILLLDDGFQHRRLRRDLDMVLIDATCPWGQGYLLPRGLLREPIRSLRRAHLVLITRCDQVSTEEIQSIKRTIAALAPHVDVIETIHKPFQWGNASRATRSLGDLVGRPLAAFCGLGNPTAFRETLIQLGGNVVAFRSYSDHHQYTRADVADLEAWACTLPADCIVVTTQKDLVKLRIDALGSRELWALHVELAIVSGQEVLEQKLTQLIPHSSSPADQARGDAANQGGSDVFHHTHRQPSRRSPTSSQVRLQQAL